MAGRGATVTCAFGYTGSNLLCVDADTVVSICGNALRFYNIHSKAERFLWGQSRAIASFAVHAKRGLVAYSEKGLTPRVHIHDFFNMELVVTLEGMATLGCAALAFDREGKRLVTVGLPPDKRLVLWEWESRAALIETVSPDEVACVSFNPYNADELMTSGAGAACVYALEKNYKAYELVARPVHKGHYAPAMHEWCPGGTSAYVGCAGGELLVASTATGELTPNAFASHAWAECDGLGALAVTRRHVILAGRDGVVRWYAHAPARAGFPDLRLVHETPLNADLPESESAAVVAMSHSTDGAYLLAATAEAQMYALALGGPLSALPDREIDRSECAAEPTLWGDYHVGPVTGVAAVGVAHVATCGLDGTLRLWDLSRKILSGRRSFAAGLTCLAASAAVGGVMAVGADNGVLRLLRPSPAGSPAVVYRVLLHRAPVDAVAWAPGGAMLAAAAGDLLYLLSAPGDAPPSRDGSYSVVGAVRLPHPAIALTWAGPLVIASFDGPLLAVVTPPADAAAAATAADAADAESLLPPWAARVALPRLSAPLVALTPAGGTAFVGLTADGHLQRYNAASLSEGALAATEDEAWAHDASGTGAVALADDGASVGSGGLDGTFSLRPAGSAWRSPPAHTLRLFDPEGGGVSALGWLHAPTGALAIAAGTDGGLFVVASPGATLPRPPPAVPPATLGDDVDVPDADDEPTAAEVRRLERARAEAVAHNSAREVLRAAAQGLRHQVTLALAKNEAAPVAERLPRPEFVIDGDYRDELAAEAGADVRRVREETKRAILERRLLRDRVVAACYESQATHGALIAGLKSGLKVHNYPLAAAGRHQELTAKALLLRRVELAEAAFWAAADAGRSGRPAAGAEPVAVVTAAADDGAAKADDAGEEGEGEEGAKDKGPAETREALLYGPFELHCQLRKATQTRVLATVSRDAMAAFNAAFRHLQERKRIDMDRIADLSARVREIQDELQVDDPLFTPHLLDGEVEGSELTIADADVTVTRYTSPAEQAALEAAAAAEDRRVRALARDNPGERALKQMMGGKLEGAKAVDVYAELPRPEFMSHPVASWTEEQAKAAKEWELKEKNFREDRERYRKAMEVEAKKIRADIADVCAKFDDALAELQRARISGDEARHGRELGLIKLSVGLEASLEADEASERALEAELESLKQRQGRAAAALAETRRATDAAREAFESASAEDRATEKLAAFKKEFADAEAYAEPLYKLFRRRRPRGEEAKPPIPPGLDRSASRKIGAKAPEPEPESLGDAYADAPETRLVAAKPPPEPLDATLDKPEGLDPAVFDRLVEHRQRKIAAEEALVKSGALLRDMAKHQAHLAEQDEGLRGRAEALMRGLQELRERRARDAFDLDVPLRVKQGQVEVDPGLVSADFSDAAFVHRSAVEEVNEVITRHGGQEVEVLQSMKDFKKGIYELRWLNTKLEMAADDITEKTKELQLLRVTKSLQQFIKHGEEVTGQSESAGLEATLEHNRVLHDKHVREKAAQLRRLRRQLGERTEQNDAIRTQVASLAQKVDEQRRIQDGQNANAAYEVTAARQRMKGMVTLRKLQDIAHAQAEEMSLLREELERLKLRSFPSFVDRQRPPAERY